MRTLILFCILGEFSGLVLFPYIDSINLIPKDDRERRRRELTKSVVLVLYLLVLGLIYLFTLVKGCLKLEAHALALLGVSLLKSLINKFVSKQVKDNIGVVDVGICITILLHWYLFGG